MGRRLDDYRRVRAGAIKVELPNTHQVHGHTCGPSALLAICAYYGVGPEWEEELAEASGATEHGTDPDQLVARAREYGLHVREFRGMSRGDLVACLKLRRPVLLMLQAWGDPPPRSYRDVWDSGHWVVAIGYDRDGVYFEDPSLHVTRGWLSWAALDERWHDVEGPAGALRQVDRYGVALWRARRAIDYRRYARTIE